VPYGQKNWTVQLTVAGFDIGRWAVAEGGGVSAEDGSYDDWDGPVRLGGKRSRGDVTVRKLYREAVHAMYRWLDARAGNGKEGKFTLTRTPTDDDGVSWGDPIIITGIVGEVNPPDVDKGSSDGGELEVVLHCDAALA
jgi:hypothetical protein